MTNTTISSNLYGIGIGTASTNPFVDIFASRDPGATDVGPPYPLQKKWFNTLTGEYFILAALSTSSGITTATWYPLIGSTNTIQHIIGNDAVSVGPTLGDINLVGDGSTVLVTGDAATSTLTITAATSGVVWQTIAASQALVADNGYFCIAPGGALSLSLPTTSSIGETIEVVLDGATSWTITQAAGQSIRIGNSMTSGGVGGSLASTQQGDSVRLVCQTANTKWNVVSSVGNITVV